MGKEVAKRFKDLGYTPNNIPAGDPDKGFGDIDKFDNPVQAVAELQQVHLHDCQCHLPKH